LPENVDKAYRPLLEAVSFAARVHDGQMRKDGRTPYVSHPVRVCLVLVEVFGITDRCAMMAALLHDALEDTTTDFDDLAEHFGANVASWAAALSKDKRLPEREREEAYLRQLSAVPWQVKVCKLGDIFDNLLDSPSTSRPQQARTLRNARRYLEALKPGLPTQAQAPWQTVNDLLVAIESRAGQAGEG